jgi:hypothetical protein
MFGFIRRVAISVWGPWVFFVGADRGTNKRASRTARHVDMGSCKFCVFRANSDHALTVLYVRGVFSWVIESAESLLDVELI